MIVFYRMFQWKWQSFSNFNQYFAQTHIESAACPYIYCSFMSNFDRSYKSCQSLIQKYIWAEKLGARMKIFIQKWAITFCSPTCFQYNYGKFHWFVNHVGNNSKCWYYFLTLHDKFSIFIFPNENEFLINCAGKRCLSLLCR